MSRSNLIMSRCNWIISRSNWIMSRSNWIMSPSDFNWSQHRWYIAVKFDIGRDRIPLNYVVTDLKFYRGKIRNRLRHNSTKLCFGKISLWNFNATYYLWCDWLKSYRDIINFDRNIYSVLWLVGIISRHSWIMSCSMCRVLTQTANHNAARSRRATAVSPGGNFSFNLNLSRYTGCREQFFFQKNKKNTNHINPPPKKKKKKKKTHADTWIVYRSRARQLPNM